MGLSAAALATTTLSGCGWTLANVRPTASTSPGDANKLYIYTWAGYTDDDLFDSFAQQTGIKAIADVMSSSEEMLAKVLAGGGGAYSIIYPSDYMVEKMVEENLLIELDLSRIEGLNQLFENYKNPVYDPQNRHSIPVSWGTTGLIYNSQKLRSRSVRAAQSQPNDWSYLWENKQELKGQITLLNDVREVMGATLKMLGYSYNSTSPQEIKAAYDRLVELKPSIASFTSDAWRPQILTGDLLIAMGYSVDASEMIDSDPNLSYAIPSSGSSLWTDTVVIPKAAPNPDGAYAWINFMLQPAVGVEITKRLNFATANQIAYEKLPEKLRKNLTLFPPQQVLAKCESIVPLPQEVTDL